MSNPLPAELPAEDDLPPNSAAAQARRARSKATYKCPDTSCAKVFRSSGHLNRHIKIHTGERQHGCPWPKCEVRCSRQDNLLQHYRTHVPKTKRANRAYIRKAFADMQKSRSSKKRGADEQPELPDSASPPAMMSGDESEEDEEDRSDDPPLSLSVPASLPSPLLSGEDSDDGASSKLDANLYRMPVPAESVPHGHTHFLDYAYSPYQLPHHAPPPLHPPLALPFPSDPSSSPVSPLDPAIDPQLADPQHLNYHYNHWPNFPAPPPSRGSIPIPTAAPLIPEFSPVLHASALQREVSWERYT